MTIKRYLNYVCMVFFVYLLLFSSVGKTEEIEENRQAMLQSRLNRLTIIINQSKQELNALDEELTTSQAELTTAKLQLNVLKSELLKLEQTSMKQKNLLENVKKYCKKLEKNQTPLTFSEYSAKLSLEDNIDGIACGRFWKLPSDNAFIGVRGTYEWKDKRTGVWVSVLI